jgi:cytochrome P450
MASEAATLHGYAIPKNTIVFGNLYSCSMDSNAWSNVNDFKPERHLDEHGQFKRNEKLIPFSIGIIIN